MNLKKLSFILSVLFLLSSSLVSAGSVTYDYDSRNRLEMATYPDGTTIEYSYDNIGNRLTMVVTNPVTEQDITVSVVTNDGNALEGVKVYAFTESGSYIGLYATTDENGEVLFALDDFGDGNYKFRVDYLSGQFWSDIITVPGNYSADVIIEEETVELTVTVVGDAKVGIKVYLFNDNGSYLGTYDVTNSDGRVWFDLPVGESFLFRADYMGNQYWSDTTEITSSGFIPVDISTGGGIFSVIVEKDIGQPLENLNLYLFSSSGSYLGVSGKSDENGEDSFVVPEGDYKVRADYLGYQFWTDIVNITGDESYNLLIPHEDITITVQGECDSDIVPREGLKVYLFSVSGSYLSQYQVTDSLGRVNFSLPDQEYKVRADYLGGQFWSEIIAWTDEIITIDEGLADITVTNLGLPLEDINVYVFSETGSYLGLNGISDIDGHIGFRLPEGDYNFRADYLGSQYWSNISFVIGHTNNPIIISTGGGTFMLTILRDIDDPLEGAKCYLFNDSGSYLGMSNTTNSDGEVSFNLADGIYRIRVDYLGYRFWSALFTIPDILSDIFTIPHEDVIATIGGTYQGMFSPVEGIKVYLFTPSGSYLGRSETTDENGDVLFYLPEASFKVRADYLGGQFWSDEFVWIDPIVEIPMAEVEITTTGSGLPSEGLHVYVFSETGSYLGLNDTTDENGQVIFLLPADTYDFRLDYQGSHYWSGPQALIEDQTNPVEISAGGGTFTFTLLKNETEPLIGVKAYLFNESGSYLSLSAITNSEGQVFFDLAEGSYQIRVDYLGYQFWSDVFNVPDMLSEVFTIPHQDAGVTIEGVYQGIIEPIAGINVYLFSPSGSYLSRKNTTDDNGQVIFILPEKEYKIRADYLGLKFWSDIFQYQDVTLSISQGQAQIHAYRSGADLENANVYLFSGTGSYLGRHETTDSTGLTEFIIPAGSFKFRIDEGGDQKWSDVTDIIADQLSVIELDLDL
jgi:hypothetical protein